MAKNPNTPDNQTQTPKPSGATKAPDPTTSQPASEIATTAKETASNLVGMARGGATSRFAKQRGRAAGQLDGIAQAIRQAGDQLREQEQETVPQYFAMAADRIEDFSGYLQRADFGDVVDGVQSFARRQPVVFIAGAFAAGLIATRFLVSSGHKRSSARGEAERVSGTGRRSAKPGARRSAMPPRAAAPETEAKPRRTSPKTGENA